MDAANEVAEPKLNFLNAMSTDFSIDEDHPLALELKSLRATVVRYQVSNSPIFKLSSDTDYV